MKNIWNQIGWPRPLALEEIKILVLSSVKKEKKNWQFLGACFSHTTKLISFEFDMKGHVHISRSNNVETTNTIVYVDQDTRLCVGGQERHKAHSVLFIGSAKSPISSPCIS